MTPAMPRRKEGNDARQYARLPDPFAMHGGGVLKDATLAYETWGALNAAQDNAILLFTGLSPSAHAASSAADREDGWWESIIGPSLAIDTDRYFVICVNSLGSCFGSTGPASIDPRTGQRYGLNFPQLAVEDIANAAWHVTRGLGIQQLDTVMGPSLGGMACLAYLALHPDGARRLISISGSAAASPFAIALRSVQREAITRDPDWQHGSYAPGRPPHNGLILARKMGTITYRSRAEWENRFARQPGRQAKRVGQRNGFAGEFMVEDYLDAQSLRFAERFDANCYLYLSRAMDRFDLAAHGKNLPEIFARSSMTKALVIGVSSDILFPIEEQQRIAAAITAGGRECEMIAMPSLQGHDAFLVDIERFAGALGNFLR
ncbi:MAG: homoserine O-acetyltransferase [Steroidobacteraceae bacterium]